MSKLLDAIKRKYRTPREAIEALGLDSRDLDADLMAGDSANSAAVGKNRKESGMSIKSKAALLTCLGLASLLRPKLAQDAALDLRPILKGITADNFSGSKPAILRRLQVALKGKLAKDASIGEVAELLDLIDSHGSEGHDDDVPEPLGKSAEKVGAKFAEPDVMDADPLAEVEGFLADKLDESDLKAVMEMLKGGGMHEHGGEDETAETEQERRDNAEEWRRGAKRDVKGVKTATDDEGHAESGAQLKKLGAATGEDDEEEYEEAKRAGPGAQDNPPPFKGMPKPGGKLSGDRGITKAALDSSIAAAVKAERQTQRDIRDAERLVQPWVGQLNMSFDSAEQVYRQALKMLGVKADGIHASALKTILDMQPLPGAKRIAAKASAMDAANIGSFHDRFPEIRRIRLT